MAEITRNYANARHCKGDLFFVLLDWGLRYPRSYNQNKSLPNAETKGVGASRNLLGAHMQRI